jgi:hypothetical protein
VPNQPREKATNAQKKPFILFFSYSPSFFSLFALIFFSTCRFHHFLDRQRATRSRMMMMTTRCRCRRQRNETTAMMMMMMQRASLAMRQEQHVASRSFCTTGNGGDDDDDFQIIWVFVLIHCVFFLLCAWSQFASDRTSKYKDKRLRTF